MPSSTSLGLADALDVEVRIAGDRRRGGGGRGGGGRDRWRARGGRGREDVVDTRAAEEPGGVRRVGRQDRIGRRTRQRSLARSAALKKGSRTYHEHDARGRSSRWTPIAGVTVSFDDGETHKYNLASQRKLKPLLEEAHQLTSDNLFSLVDTDSSGTATAPEYEPAPLARLPAARAARRERARAPRRARGPAAAPAGRDPPARGEPLPPPSVHPSSTLPPPAPLPGTPGPPSHRASCALALAGRAAPLRRPPGATRPAPCRPPPSAKKHSLPPSPLRPARLPRASPPPAQHPAAPAGPPSAAPVPPRPGSPARPLCHTPRAGSPTST